MESQNISSQSPDPDPSPALRYPRKVEDALKENEKEKEKGAKASGDARDDKSYDSEPFTSSDSDSDSITLELDRKVVARLREAAEDDMAHRTLAEVLEETADPDDALANGYEFIRELKDWLRSIERDIEDGKLSERVKRRKRKLKERDPERWKNWQLAPRKKEERKPHSCAQLPRLWKYPRLEKWGMAETDRDDPYSTTNRKHSLDCPEYDIGARVGVGCILGIIFAEGIIRAKDLKLGRYKVEISRSHDSQYELGQTYVVLS